MDTETKFVRALWGIAIIGAVVVFIMAALVVDARQKLEVARQEERCLEAVLAMQKVLNLGIVDDSVKLDFGEKYKILIREDYLATQLSSGLVETLEQIGFRYVGVSGEYFIWEGP